MQRLFWICFLMVNYMSASDASSVANSDAPVQARGIFVVNETPDTVLTCAYTKFFYRRYNQELPRFYVYTRQDTQSVPAGATLFYPVSWQKKRHRVQKVYLHIENVGTAKKIKSIASIKRKDCREHNELVVRYNSNNCVRTPKPDTIEKT